MQLTAISERVLIVPGPANVGVIRLADDRVALVDSGLERRYARKILELLSDYHFKIDRIYNTHGHADHVGGNRFLQDETGCRIYAGPLEVPAIQNPLMQAIALFGGLPFEELKKFQIVAEPSMAELFPGEFTEIDGVRIEMLDLPGHSIGQKGFLVDGVAFLADTLFPTAVVDKHHIVYLYSPDDHLETLKKLRTLKAKTFVGGHFPPEKSIDRLISDNQRQVEIAMKFLRTFLATPQPLDRLVKEFLGHFGVKRGGWEHFLYRSTLNGYLSCLRGRGEADFKVMDNLLIWFATAAPAPPAGPKKGQ